MPEPLALVTWDRRHPTGGNLYNESLAAALRELGRPVEVIRLGGAWPEGDPAAYARLTETLAAHPVSLVDGVVGSNAPEAIAAAVTAGRRVFVLVHLPLGTAVEARALRAASGVIATSRHSADRLALRTELPRAIVAVPGVQVAPIAAGSVPLRILAVANLVPGKDQLNLVQALALIADLPWSARLVGSVDVDPPYAALVRRTIDDLGLTGRVALTGSLQGAALDAEWAAADLLSLASRQEAYGMVVAEALAHGIPAVVAAGTGAVEALTGGDQAQSAGPSAVEPAVGRASRPPAGTAVMPGNPDGLARVLRRWLTDPDLRAAWRTAAEQRRTALPTWHDTARVINRALSHAA